MRLLVIGLIGRTCQPKCILVHHRRSSLNKKNIIKYHRAQSDKIFQQQASLSKAHEEARELRRQLDTRCAACISDFRVSRVPGMRAVGSGLSSLGCPCCAPSLPSCILTLHRFGQAEGEAGRLAEECTSAHAATAHSYVHT